MRRLRRPAERCGRAVKVVGLGGPSDRSSKGGVVLRGGRRVKCECSKRGWSRPLAAVTLLHGDKVSGVGGWGGWVE